MGLLDETCVPAARAQSGLAERLRRAQARRHLRRRDSLYGVRVACLRGHSDGADAARRLWGMSCIQTFNYFTSSPNDATWIKTLVRPAPRLVRTRP
jgi:hypothetical protein